MGSGRSRVPLLARAAVVALATARWGLEQWACEGHGQSTIVFLGNEVAEEAAEPALRGCAFAVHAGQRGGTSTASHWVADRPAAIDLLAQIALGRSHGSSSRGTRPGLLEV